MWWSYLLIRKWQWFVTSHSVQTPLIIKLLIPTSFHLILFLHIECFKINLCSINHCKKNKATWNVYYSVHNVHRAEMESSWGFHCLFNTMNMNLIWGVHCFENELLTTICVHITLDYPHTSLLTVSKSQLFSFKEITLCWQWHLYFIQSIGDIDTGKKCWCCMLSKTYPGMLRSVNIRCFEWSFVFDTAWFFFWIKGNLPC